MPKEKISLNSIYISDRLQKSLQPVSNSALTAITAPISILGMKKDAHLLNAFN